MTEGLEQVWGFKPEAAFNFSLAISFAIVIVLSPILSSIADVVGNKLKFLKLFCYVGALSCIGLFFFKSTDYITLALILNIIASVGFWGSLVFYNSYLPEIADEEDMDKLSAKGFIWGYVGSVILLVICLVLIMFIADDASKGFYTRLSFLLTGVWWMGFAQYTFSVLPKGKKGEKVSNDFIQKSFKELFVVQKELFAKWDLKFFLLSFFFYSLGIQTIFLMATLFGKVEIGLETSKLIMTILIIQLEAILGAWLFSYLSKKIGNFKTLMMAIFVWIIICIFGYLIEKSPQAEYHFYGIAAMVGLVMGGIQALSRSTYSKLLPETEDTTTFFSFYDVFEKLALLIGLLLFFVFTQYGSGMKQAVLAMGVSFIISLLIMIYLDRLVKRM